MSPIREVERAISARVTPERGSVETVKRGARFRDHVVVCLVEHFHGKSEKEESPPTTPTTSNDGKGKVGNELRVNVVFDIEVKTDVCVRLFMCCACTGVRASGRSLSLHQHVRFTRTESLFPARHSPPKRCVCVGLSAAALVRAYVHLVAVNYWIRLD